MRRHTLHSHLCALSLQQSHLEAFEDAKIGRSCFLLDSRSLRFSDRASEKMAGRPDLAGLQDLWTNIPISKHQSLEACGLCLVFQARNHRHQNLA